MGQQVMIPTPGRTNKRFGIGAVNCQTVEPVVIIRQRKRREQIAELLTQLLDKHPTQMVYVARDNADTPNGGEMLSTNLAASHFYETKLLVSVKPAQA